MQVNCETAILKWVDLKYVSKNDANPENVLIRMLVGGLLNVDDE